ncbi:hypothetical protein ABK040_003539 [Willaertia magna]
MKEIVKEYPIIKERYLNVKVITGDDIKDKKYQMIYEQNKVAIYLKKKYSEQKFNWLLLSLSSLIKVIKANLYFPHDMNRFNRLIEKSLKINSNNFYTLLVKANYLKFISPKNDQHITELVIKAKELCERVSTVLVETTRLTVNIKYSYTKKAIEEFKLVELFTRFPLEGSYYLVKGNAFYKLNIFEQTIKCYQYVNKYSSFQNLAMGYRQICLEELNKYIEKYDGHIYLKLKKVIIENMLCKSKIEFAIVKNKYANLINEVSSPSFIMTDEIRPYI